MIRSRVQWTRLRGKPKMSKGLLKLSWMDMDIAPLMLLLLLPEATCCIHCVALLDSDGIAAFHGNTLLVVDSLFVLY